MALVAVLFCNALPVMAAKPSQVIETSNGFPSGFHFNLNIHGKDPLTFNYDPGPYNPPTESPYWNNIFIPEDTSVNPDPENYPITIQCISDKRGNGTELEVIDPYAFWPTDLVPDGDGVATFKLPYKIQPEEGGDPINACGYFVYGRILGKPNNNPQDEGEPSEIILTPNPVLECSDYDESMIPLGLVTNQGTYKMTEAGFERFENEIGDKRGKSKAKNITDMFMWSGWVVYDTTLDTNDESESGEPDGKITYHDIPLDDYDLDAGTDPNHDYNADGNEDSDDVDAWLTDLTLSDPSIARYYDNWWVFDVADIVLQSWGVENHGTKLLQIRFYPVATTTFTETGTIVVRKETNPTDDSTLFDFTTNIPERDPFQLNGKQFCSNLGLGSSPDYWVQEGTLPKGWALTGIDIQDPTNGGNPADYSYYDLNERKAYINLAEGERVIVTFTNTQSQIIVVKEYLGIDPPSTTFNYTSDFGVTSLTGDGASYESEYLTPNSYYVTETTPLEPWWTLTSIIIDDPDGGSPTPSGDTATIDLDAGEVVTVTFINSYTAPE